MAASHKFLIVDDDAIVRMAIASMVEKSFPRSEITLSSSLDEGLALLERAKWDLILLDLGLGKANGMTLIHRCIAHEIATPILVVSSKQEEAVASCAFRAGAKGFICKEQVVSGEHLQEALNRMLLGQTYISPLFTDQLIQDLMTDKYTSLSQQESSVLIHIGAGHTIKEIASIMDLSEKTIRTYRGRLLEKLSLNSDAAVIRYAFENGLVN